MPPSPTPLDSSRPSRRRFIEAVGLTAGLHALPGVASGADAAPAPLESVVDGIEAAAVPIPTGNDVPPQDPVVAVEAGVSPDGIATAAAAEEYGTVADVVDGLAAYPILGLGESTHGTHEFHAIRRRLVQELVAEHGLGVIGFEDQFSTLTAANDYVVHGEGTLREAMRGFSFWVWQTAEVRRLLAWLREFNSDRPCDDRVQVHGVDCQRTAPPASAILAYLDDADVSGLSEARSVLETIAASSVGSHFLEGAGSADGDRVDAARTAVVAVRERLDERRDRYVATTSSAEYVLARRHLRTLEQAVASVEARAESMPAGQQARDRGMAENTSWLLDAFDAEQVAVWGHNAHLQADVGLSRSQGNFLRQRHGEDYYALGFEFGTGSFRAITGGLPGTDEATMDAPAADAAALMSDVSFDAFFLDFAAAAEDEDVAGWLDGRRELHQIGAAYSPEDPTNSYRLDAAFDGLAFVRESTPTVSHIVGRDDGDDGAQERDG